jgi:tubulin-specific chaperone E
MATTHHVGQRISYDGALCTVRFVGEVSGTTGTWLGVEWDDSARGKHDGCHKGVRYFTCKTRPDQTHHLLYVFLCLCLLDN